MEEALAEKDLALRGIQRNYEGLSSLLQFKQQEIQELRTEAEVVAAEKADLSVRLDDALQRATSAEARYSELAKSMQGQAGLQTALSKAEFNASVANERAKALKDKLKDMEAQVGRLEADRRRLEGEVQRSYMAADSLRDQKSADSSYAEDLRSQKQALESEVRARQDGMKQLQHELLETQKTLVALRRAAKQHERMAGEAEDANRRLRGQLEEGQAAAKASDVRWAAAVAQEGAAATAAEAAAARQAELQARLGEREAQYGALLSRKAEVGGALDAMSAELASTKASLADSEAARLAEAEMADEAIARGGGRCGEAAGAHGAAPGGGALSQGDRKVAARAEAAGAQPPAGDAGRVGAADERAAAEGLETGDHGPGGRAAGGQQCGHFLTVESTGAADRSSLESRLRRADDELAAERIAHRHTATAKEAAEEESGRQMAHLRELFERELAEAQGGLTTKLGRVEEEMQRLRECSDAERASTVAAAQQESEMLRTKLAALHEEHRAHQARAAEELASQRAVLTTEMQSALDSQQQAAHMLERALSDGFDVALQLAGKAGPLTTAAFIWDVQAVDKHLVAMGITQVSHDLPAHFAEGDRGGPLLRKLLNHCRTHHAHVAEAVQDMINAFRQAATSAELQAGAQQASLQAELRAKLEAFTQREDALEKMIAACVQTVSEISGDVEAVGRHLVAMDVPVVAAAAKEGEGEAGGEEGAPAAGRPLDHRLAALRLRFSYVAEAVQELVNTKRGATEGVLGPGHEEAEKELRNTVAKLAHAESSQESFYTCIRCLEIFRRPVSCVPCGHTYCLSCLEHTETDGAYSCEECEGARVEAFVHNLPMEGLCTKYEYKLMALKSLQKMLKAPARPPSK
eukprot:jgi/Tetstr1/459815/TSEL_005165.t1